jgi:hypothetical protein
VERWRKRPVLILSNLGQAALFSLVPQLAFVEVLGVGCLVAVAFAVGARALFFELAYHSYLPRLVRREDLVEPTASSWRACRSRRSAGPGWEVRSLSSSTPQSGARLTTRIQSAALPGTHD